MSESNSATYQYTDFLNSKDLQESKIEADENTSTLTLQETSIRYFSGYVVLNLFKKIQCEDCLYNLRKIDEHIGNNIVMTSSSELLLFNKNYFNQPSDFGGLVPPSDVFFEVCQLDVKIFANIFKTNPEVDCIKETIKTMCIQATLNDET